MNLKPNENEYHFKTETKDFDFKKIIEENSDQLALIIKGPVNNIIAIKKEVFPYIPTHKYKINSMFINEYYHGENIPKISDTQKFNIDDNEYFVMGGWMFFNAEHNDIDLNKKEISNIIRQYKKNKYGKNNFKVTTFN